jgi:23S rRNA (guanosine2251-2'-O)-methyltransferase
MSRTSLIYGVHAVQAVLQRQAQRVRQLYIAEQRDDARVKAILALAQENRCSLQRLVTARLDQMTDNGVHQGVVAEIEPLPPWTENELLDALINAKQPLLLALDGVQDPHNLGACLRTADACGALAVIVPKDRAAQLTPAVRKVAAGAAETTPVVAVTNLVRTLKCLKDAGLWVVGADIGATQRIDHVDLQQGVVVVCGAEATGLRQLTKANCDVLVALPNRGAVQSLNVSVAAGMLLFEVLRQRGL